MTKYELVAVTKKIINDVNEINQKFNESLKASKSYISKIDAIKSKSPLLKAEEEIEKAMKITQGTNYKDGFSVKVTCLGNTSIAQRKVEDEITEYNLAVFKRIIKIRESSWSKEYSSEFNEVLDKLIIAQVDASDLQTMCNTIKASLI